MRPGHPMLNLRDGRTAYAEDSSQCIFRVITFTQQPAYFHNLGFVQFGARRCRAFILAATAIVRLLFPGRPTTVRGRVISIVVVAFNRVARRRFAAHIGQEVFKAAAPALTNADTASAVVHERFVALPIAALAQMRPAAIFGGPVFPSAMSMLHAVDGSTKGNI